MKFYIIIRVLAITSLHAAVIHHIMEMLKNICSKGAVELKNAVVVEATINRVSSLPCNC